MASTRAVRRNKQDGETRPRVWSARICPFAERVLFALSELKIDFDSEIIDLNNKPPRLLEINPEGKVPTIEDLGAVLYESMICVEYLDEAFQSPTGRRLLPDKALERAKFRILADYVSNKFVPKFYAILRASTEQETAKCIDEMLRTIAEIDGKMRQLSPDGPFFAGKEPGYLDILLTPHVRRFTVLNHYKGFVVPNTSEYTRFNKWRDACLIWPSYKVIKENIPEEELNIAFKKYTA